MVKNILFDLDGTLTDPKIGITKSVAYALEKFNIKVDNLDNLIKFIGPPLKDSFVEYYSFSENDTIAAIKYYREYFSEKGLYENTVFNGVEKLLIKLKKCNNTLIVATSKPTIYALEILKHFNLLNYFDFVAGSELDGTRSDKAEVISYALSQMKITDNKTAIMIGDRKHDIIGAQKNKLKSIGVLYGYGDLPELQKAKADYIVSNLNELELLLTQK